MNWDKGRYHVQRICTCKSRSHECVTAGFHTVATSEDDAAARKEAASLAAEVHVAYRTVDSHSGKVMP
jgi:hypothetical protein